MTAFFDTNVLIYAQQSGAKAEKAREWLARGGMISVQVLNEFAAVLSRKLGRSWSDIATAIDDILMVVDPPLPLTVELHVAARALAATHHLPFNDALIIAAARDSQCRILLSDDLQAGRRFGGLKIIDPFGKGQR
jgi:predicted nucleic acid-binding protein